MILMIKCYNGPARHHPDSVPGFEIRARQILPRKWLSNFYVIFLSVLLESDQRWPFQIVTFSNLVRLPDFSPSSDRSGLNRFFNGFSYLGTKKITVQHFLQTSRCITINFILWFEYVLSKYLLMMLEVGKKFCTRILLFQELREGKKLRRWLSQNYILAEIPKTTCHLSITAGLRSYHLFSRPTVSSIVL